MKLIPKRIDEIDIGMTVAVERAWFVPGEHVSTRLVIGNCSLTTTGLVLRRVLRKEVQGDDVELTWDDVEGSMTSSVGNEFLVLESGT
jgi:hypothetical protein